MQKALRRFDPLSSLNVVFVITIVMLLVACVAVVAGILNLFNMDARGMVDPGGVVDRFK